MVFSVLLVIIGFAMLIIGANWLVDGASSLAKRYKISDLAIGLTIVAFGTSAPELVVNVIASSKGYSDIVLGNIIGSNNFNLFIILGISGLVFPISVQSSTAWKEIPISLTATLFLLLLANDFYTSQNTSIDRLDASVMLILFLAFLYYAFTQTKTESNEDNSPANVPTLKIWLLIIFGLTGLIVGGQLVVNYSVKIASELGVSEKVIGLTIVAAGTSLPELVTSLVAALKRNSDIAIGNVLGSNVFNILLILSVSSMVKPVGFNPDFNADLYILLGGTAFLFIAMFTGKKKKLDRWEAGLLLRFYLLYTCYLVLKEV
ncbi:K+-dependent Na+/Ca+ exchanger (plasmid) [Fulvitalea axinellae]|uniref:K+-dependent Na+/Ca+ exchanger n=1 Tax=Fulvitalea axinellae TaxID=1182444 RepID=A0AAU9DHV9_9BACT|nr:K+-dependent Na+/Ca+ exchanger [Fulvitalea axinellae]